MHLKVCCFSLKSQFWKRMTTKSWSSMQPICFSAFVFCFVFFFSSLRWAKRTNRYWKTVSKTSPNLTGKYNLSKTKIKTLLSSYNGNRIKESNLVCTHLSDYRIRQTLSESQMCQSRVWLPPKLDNAKIFYQILITITISEEKTFYWRKYLWKRHCLS